MSAHNGSTGFVGNAREHDVPGPNSLVTRPCEAMTLEREVPPPDALKTSESAWPSLQDEKKPRTLANLWNWIQCHLRTHQARKRLKVCESISLGEKRFIAVVQVDAKQFLIGGTSHALSVLAHLESATTFPDLLKQCCEPERRQP